MSTAPSAPIWLARHRAPVLPDLSTLHADVVVLGAGIAGLTCALCLLQEGRQVLVVEREAIGAGETLRTSAHLANALDDRFWQLEDWFGEDGARLAAESHGAAIDWIERFVRDCGDDCGFARVDGYLFAHGADPQELDREHAAARRAGLRVERLDAGLPGFALGPALRFRDQARIDIARYLDALSGVVRELGGRIERAKAVAVEGGDVPRIELEDGRTLRASSVVIATNVPFHERIPVHTKLEPYRTYMIAVEAERGAVPDALLWDNGDPYHYVRWVDDVLIIGGEDHKVGQPDSEATLAPYQAIHAWAQRHLPGIGALRGSWSGQIIEPVDGLAYIGRDPGHADNVFIVTGDSGNGLTHGTLAGPLIAALVQGEEHPWAGLYDPRRKPVRAAREWTRVNVNVAAQFADWLRGGEAPDVQALAPGDGAVIRDGVHRVAVHRDAHGRLHAFNARCPHVGCAVRWNARESTWDCPCHGSRFAADSGAVLNGPAPHGLEPLRPPSP
ncbi:MAG TPA: FAD-dependent oxidoreductase [Lysobacter sp.]|nr:FAD-dependent oxidoreductase [Lysobacter sp.]